MTACQTQILQFLIQAFSVRLNIVYQVPPWVVGMHNMSLGVYVQYITV